MHKKTILLTALLIVGYIGTQAQPWLNSLNKSTGKQTLTLKEHKQAFDAYWAPYNVENGYYYEDGVKKKAYGWKQFMRWYHEMQTQVNPKTGAFPEKTAQQIYDEFKQSNTNMRSPTFSANWVNLGTNSSTGGYAGIGRISAIAFHPTDNNTYWIGAPAGGVWCTTDNGNTWACLTDDNQVLGVSNIIIPTDYETSQTIYIATGDRDTWDNRSIGVLKSTDGGATWNTTGLTFTLGQERKVTKMLLDPNDNQTIIAATNHGVYKTTDGANTWNQLSDKSFIDMEYKPGDVSTLYGSTTDGKIYISTDGGTNWNSTFSNGRRVELAVSAADANLVIAVIANNQGGLMGLYKSTDSGASFTQILDGSTTNLLGYAANGSSSGGQGWYDLSLAISPTDANLIFVGGINTWKSTDGGNTWNISNYWWGNGVQVVHADKHVLAFRLNGDLFEGNDGGVYISTDSGTSWTDKSNGLVISQMYKLGVSAQESGKVVTGLQDNGSKLLENGTWQDVTGGDGMECLIDYTNSDIQYATYSRGVLYRTENNWNDYTTITPKEGGQRVKGAWVTPYVMSPIDHNTLYAGYADVWKTTDRGNTWSKVSSFNATNKANCIAIASSNCSVLYLSKYSSMWKTTDDGATWTQITLPCFGYITYITVKDDDENHLWITMASYNDKVIFESTDGGNTWNNISAGLPEIPVYSIVQNKQITNEVHLYAGTELGVYFKRGDNNWTEYNEGLPKVKCGEIEIYYDNTNPENSRLRLASYGRGLWETPLVNTNILPSLTTSEANSITSESFVCEGNITADGGSEVTERGIVWSTTTEPVLSDHVFTDSETGLGSFTANITGLSAATTYYARAYATNEKGTSYGNEIVFTTLCGITSQFPFGESFEGNNFPPKCWTSFREGNNLASDWAQAFGGHSGSKSACIAVNSNTKDWFVTPYMALPSASATLSFYERKELPFDCGSSYAIKISTSSQTNTASFTTLESYGETAVGTSYAKREIDLSAYIGQNVYIAFVMTSNNGDCWYLDDVKIDGLNIPIVVGFSATSTEVCAGTSISFTDESTGNPDSWSWDFGDGTEVSTEQNPTHIYDTKGKYNVSLTAANIREHNTLEKQEYITTHPLPNSGTDGSLEVCKNASTPPSESDLFAALGGTPDTGGVWTQSGKIYTYTVNSQKGCGASSSNVEILEIDDSDPDCSPLPIQLFSFDVSINKGIVLLEWRSLSEVNNDYYQVYKSENTLDWKFLARIPGGGNTITEQYYYLQDQEPYLGLTYYRLTQTDFDGRTAELGIRSINTPHNTNTLTISPNPSSDKVNIFGNYGDIKTLKLINILGKNVLAKAPISVLSNHHLVLDLSALPSGTYVLITEFNNNTKIIKE